jgi:hypothetical protein
MLRLVVTAQAQGGMGRRVATQFASLRQLRPLHAASTDQQVDGIRCGMPQQAAPLHSNASRRRCCRRLPPLPSRRRLPPLLCQARKLHPQTFAPHARRVSKHSQSTS